jgi:hypothetical protein
MCRCYMNASARVGAYRSRPAEALQKGESGWTAFCYPSLPYFISPFVKRPLGGGEAAQQRPGKFVRSHASLGRSANFGELLGEMHVPVLGHGLYMRSITGLHQNRILPRRRGGTALAARYFGALREAEVRFAALSARSFCSD